MSEELKSLLQEYKENQEAIKKEVESVDLEIARLQSYRNSLTHPYEVAIQDIETKIRIIMFETKKSYDCDIGRISYRKGGVKRSWDIDALDLSCKIDDHIKAVIWQFRKETSFEPSISIKLNK